MIKNREYIIVGAMIVVFAIMGLYFSVSDSVEKHSASEFRENNLNSQIDKCALFFVYDKWSDTLDNQGSSLIHADNICFVSAEEAENIKWKEVMAKYPGKADRIIFYISENMENREDIYNRFCDELMIKNDNCIWKDNYLVMLTER